MDLSIIIKTENPRIIYKKYRRKRNKTRLQMEYNNHILLYNLYKTNNFKYLRIPKPYELTNRGYYMEYIDSYDKHTENIEDCSENFQKEYKKYSNLVRDKGYILNDVEFMICDDVVYIIDFDKLGIIKGDYYIIPGLFDKNKEIYKLRL